VIRQGRKDCTNLPARGVNGPKRVGAIENWKDKRKRAPLGVGNMTGCVDGHLCRANRKASGKALGSQVASQQLTLYNIAPAGNLRKKGCAGNEHYSRNIKGTLKMLLYEEKGGGKKGERIGLRGSAEKSTVRMES